MRFGKRWKSDGARSDEYGGCGTIKLEAAVPNGCHRNHWWMRWSIVLMKQDLCSCYEACFFLPCKWFDTYFFDVFMDGFFCVCLASVKVFFLYFSDVSSKLWDGAQWSLLPVPHPGWRVLVGNRQTDLWQRGRLWSGHHQRSWGTDFPPQQECRDWPQYDLVDWWVNTP